MQQQSTSITLEALEALCDVLDAVGSERLPTPLNLTRHRLHQALGMTGEVSEDDICGYLTTSLADIASEARREDQFDQFGVVLSPSREVVTL